MLETAPAAHTEQARGLPLSGAVRVPSARCGQSRTARLPRLHGAGGVGRDRRRRSGHGAAVGIRRARVKDIQIGGVSQSTAIHEQSVTLLLEDEIDISRGDLLVKTGEAARRHPRARCHVCWLAETPLSPARTYLLRHTTREVRARVADIDYRLDVNTLEREPAAQLEDERHRPLTLKLAQPIFPDPYALNRATGAFILIDESTNNTVGAGHDRGAGSSLVKNARKCIIVSWKAQ
jgi:sulfate adenylyltransferase subunit 1